MKKIILLLLATGTISMAFGQLQRPPVQKFTPSEYGQSYSSNAFSVVEDENGIIYMGTAFGVLQYDGSTWRYIKVKAGSYVTALAVHNNTVYVGGTGEFGYLKVNPEGQYQYHSLMEGLSGSDVELTRIWRILAWNSNVVFQSEEVMLFYSNDSLTIVKPETSFHLSFVCGNDLYARERSIGLLKFNGSKFEKVNGSERFAEIGVFGILPKPQGGRFIVTRENGIWSWEGETFTKLKLSNRVDDLIARSIVVGAIPLDDGNFAIFTLKQGVLVFDFNFNLLSNFTLNIGLLTSEILDLTQDSSGNLWAATPKGLNRIQYTSPFSFFGQASGLYGEILAVAPIQQGYLVGTSQGLFISSSEGIKVFSEVENIGGSVWAIKQTPRGLWIATDNGLWNYNGVDFFRVNRTQVTALTYVDERQWVVAAGSKGMVIIDADSQNVLLTLSDIKVDAYGIAYVISRNGDCELWIGSKNSGAWQVVVKSDLRMKLFDVYGPLDGLEEDWVCPYQIDNDVLFATSQGMLKFISADEIYKMLKDSTVSVFDIRGMFSPVDFPKNALDNAVTAFHFDAKTSYIGLDYFVNSLNMSDSIASDYLFKSLRLGKINILERNGDKLLIGGRDGFVVANFNPKETRKHPVPKLMLRSITIGVDSVLWWGDKPMDEIVLDVSYELNSMQVALSSVYQDNGMSAEYAWRLKGNENEYSKWTTQSLVQINNLREGEYYFEAKARNIHGEESNVVGFGFRIFPPWYRTVWAYALYIVMLIALVYGVVQMNIKRLKAQNKRLEEIVQQRTREVVEQKEHIEVQKERIEEILKDIRSSINYAQRIQQAMLPSQELFEKHLAGHFIIFYPRDVVSGDFYWAIKVKDWIVITVADCTGHGVPGAFMSMLGISLLNEIVGKKGVLVPSQILGDMRQAIIEALKQSTQHASQKDGMDMSIVAINLKTRVCNWAGANNPLYIVRNNSKVEQADFVEDKKHKVIPFDCCTLYEMKQDRMPVAIHTIMEDFENHEVQLKEGDRLYMFSDGYTDQFGGNDYRKFMAKAFKELVASTSLVPIGEQGVEIEKTFKEWMNYKDLVHEQIDDVTVIGIQV